LFPPTRLGDVITQKTVKRNLTVVRTLYKTKTKYFLRIQCQYFVADKWRRNVKKMLKKKEKTKGRSERVSEESDKDSDVCRPHNMLLFLRKKLAGYKEESSE
jgi:ribosomal protein L32E